jgi:hypothetical protein
VAESVINKLLADASRDRFKSEFVKLKVVVVKVEV